MFEFLDRLRAKPKVVRQRIALGTSVGVTGVITAAWLAVLFSGNAFALKGSTLAQGEGSGDDLSNAFTETRSSFTTLLGAARASFGANASGGAGIVVVDSTSAEAASTSEPVTVLSF